MAVRKQNNVAYSLGQPTSAISPEPIIAKRAPTPDDKAQPGTIWVDQTTDAAYILTTIQDNAARWSDVSGDGIQEIQTDLGIVAAANGQISLNGDTNITVEGMGAAANVRLNDRIQLPETNADKDEGVISIGPLEIYAYGNNPAFPSSNIFITNDGPISTLIIDQKVGMIAIGQSAMTQGGNSDAVAIGRSAMQSNNSPSAIAIGAGTLSANTAGGFSAIAIGSSAMNDGGGSNSIAIGNAAMFSNTAASSIAIGQNAFLDGSGDGVIAIGSNTMISSTANRDNSIAIGSSAMLLSGSYSDAIAIGRETMQGTLAGGNNAIAIGNQAMNDSAANTDGIAIGRQAMNRGGGVDAIAIGRESMFLAGSAGIGAIAIGSQSMQTDAGDYSIAIGFGTMSTGCGELCIAIGALSGNDTPSTVDNCIYLANPGDAAETNGTIRIGNDTDHLRAFISGIRGVTTGVNDAIPVVIDSAGQLGTVSSSLRFKENIEEIESESAKLYQTRPVSFTYKDQTTPEKHYGFIAEEFESLFPELVVKDDGQPTTIKYHELYALMIKEIQNLRAEIDVLKYRMSGE